MKEFIYFSSSASTSGKAISGGDLMKAGRMDIVIHFLINSFFLSRSVREDVKLHLIFYGMPDPPKHIEITLKRKKGVSKEEILYINKKDVAGLIKKILYKYKKGERREIFPGCFIEKKSFLKVVEELQDQGKEIFILDKKGKKIRELKDSELKNSVFIFGDHDGLPPKELRRLKKTAKMINLGPKMYFASQAVTILNNEFDIRGI